MEDDRITIINDIDLSSSSAQTIADIGSAFVYIEAEGVPTDNSTGAILHYCKQKILKPYFTLLSVLGWRPLLFQWRHFEHYNIVKILNWCYTLLVIMFIITGYGLQYTTCYRHDGFPTNSFAEITTPRSTRSTTAYHTTRSSMFNDLSVLDGRVRDYFKENSTKADTEDYDESSVCPGNSIALYIVPDALHFLAYLLVLYFMRNPSCERSEHLMERSFLQTSRTTDWPLEHRKLVKTLLAFLWFCLIWFCASVAIHILHIFVHRNFFYIFKPPSDEWKWFLITLTVATLSLNDLVCAAIVTSYSVHCQLNIFYITNLCRSMTEKRIDFQEFYKRVEESRKFVDYLNSDQALCVSPLIVNFSCRALVAIYAITRQAEGWQVKTQISILFCFLLWICLLILPLMQGFRLTDACTSLQELGHLLRSRPFGYQDAPQENLDSLLLYTTTLRMQAKILHIPIRGSSIALLVFILVTILILLGQIND